MRKLVKQNSGKEDAKIETFSDLSKSQERGKSTLFISISIDPQGLQLSCSISPGRCFFSLSFFFVMQVPDLSLIARHLLQ